MSQHEFNQLLEQIKLQQMQITALQAIIAEEREEEKGFNTGFNIEVAKLLVFTRKAEKVAEFITVCRLYLRMRMREVAVEKQVQ